jgi:hypothetical protein
MGVKVRAARKPDNLTAICEPIVLKSVGASTSHNPMGLHGVLQGYLFVNFLRDLEELRTTTSDSFISMFKIKSMSEP